MLEKQMTAITPEHLKYMNIGRRYWGVTRKSLSESQVEAVGMYLVELQSRVLSGVGLYLWGDNSMGKSHIAAILCKTLWGAYGITSYCVTASELKEAWIEDVPASAGATETMVSRTETVPFLVIDDIGREHRAKSGFAETVFGALLRKRARNKLATCLTSNMSGEDFLNVYGKGSFELVQECMIFVNLTGKNHRHEIHQRLAAGHAGSEEI